MIINEKTVAVNIAATRKQIAANPNQGSKVDLPMLLPLAEMAALDIEPDNTFSDGERLAYEALRYAISLSNEGGNTNYGDYAPSWYIYTDCDGCPHTEVFGEITEDAFFTKVSEKIAFSDLNDSTVQKIFYQGVEVEYAGWQRGMKFEYIDSNDNTVWVASFPEWDH